MPNSWLGKAPDVGCTLCNAQVVIELDLAKSNREKRQIDKTGGGQRIFLCKLNPVKEDM